MFTVLGWGTFSQACSSFFFLVCFIFWGWALFNFGMTFSFFPNWVQTVAFVPQDDINGWITDKKIDLCANTPCLCLDCGNVGGEKRLLPWWIEREPWNVSRGACQHDRLRLEFYIDWGEQQSMKIGATRSCSLCFSKNIPDLKKKRGGEYSWGGRKGICSTRAGIGCEGWARLQRKCHSLLSVPSVVSSPLQRGVHHPPSTASSVSAQSWFFTLDYEEMFGAGGTKKQLLLWLLTTIETMLGRLKQSEEMWRCFTSTDKMLGSIKWPKDALLCQHMNNRNQVIYYKRGLESWSMYDSLVKAKCIRWRYTITNMHSRQNFHNTG